MGFGASEYHGPVALKANRPLRLTAKGLDQLFVLALAQDGELHVMLLEALQPVLIHINLQLYHLIWLKYATDLRRHCEEVWEMW